MTMHNTTNISSETSTPIIIKQDWHDLVHIKIRLGDGHQQRYWLRYNLARETEKQKIRDWNSNQGLKR